MVLPSTGGFVAFSAGGVAEGLAAFVLAAVLVAGARAAWSLIPRRES